MVPVQSHPLNNLRVAIIGFGNAGSTFHAPLVSTTPGMQVSAIVTSNPERQRLALSRYPAIQLYKNAEELWQQASQYDLVVVASTNRTHVSLGLAAMQAGLPVVIDKPLAASVSDAELLIEASKKTGKLFTIFQNRRWDNDFLTVQKLLASKILGPITRFESRFERYRAEPRPGAWRESADPADAGGLLYDIGGHLIDQALFLFGKAQRVYAEMAQRRPDVQVDDDTFVALHFESGVEAHLWMSLVARHPGPRVRLSGLAGIYEKWGLDPQEDALRTGLRPGNANWGLEPPDRWGNISTDVGNDEQVHIEGKVETLAGCYEKYYVLVRDALIAHGPLPVEPTAAINVLRVIEAAQQSAKQRKVVLL